MKKIIMILVLFLASAAFATDEVKEADLAGSWYPASGAELKGLIEGYMNDAKPEAVDGEILAIISPHAGYRFSGPVAAYGFKAAQSKKVKTAIILGFTHRKFFDGISVYNKGAFRTPLGEAAVDTALANSIISQHPKIYFNPDAFNGENSVEMQIPFVQSTWKDVKIVPIAFGAQVFQDALVLGNALAEVLRERSDYIIIASTDMSHYHAYNEAKAIDEHTIRLLKAMDGKSLYDEAQMGICELCGTMPVAATFIAAKKIGFDNIAILRYANSGDTFGGHENVVGYLSAAVYKNSLQPPAISKKKEEKNMLNDTQRKRLLEIARESITGYVRDGKRRQLKESDPVLNEPMGAFVTLHENGELRGCIGNMIGYGRLCDTVNEMAIEAATGDPRFSRLSPQEIDKVDIEISVLSPMKKVSGHEEVKIPGHGVLVKRGSRSGVYLPQVAVETGWSKEEFLTSLCAHKAGMAPDAWKDPATEIYIFTAEIFGEKDK